MMPIVTAQRGCVTGPRSHSHDTEAPGWFDLVVWGMALSLGLFFLQKSGVGIPPGHWGLAGDGMSPPQHDTNSVILCEVRHTQTPRGLWRGAAGSETDNEWSVS